MLNVAVKAARAADTLGVADLAPDIHPPGRAAEPARGADDRSGGAEHGVTCIT